MDNKIIVIILILIGIYYIYNKKSCGCNSEPFEEVRPDTPLKSTDINSIYEYVNYIFKDAIKNTNKISEKEVKEIEATFNPDKTYPLRYQNDTTIDFDRVSNEPMFMARVQPFIDRLNKDMKVNFKFTDLYEYKETSWNNKKIFRAVISIHDGNIRVSRNLLVYGDNKELLYAVEVGNKKLEQIATEPIIPEKLAVFEPTILERVDYRLLDHDYLKLPFDKSDNNKNYRLERLDDVERDKIDIENKKLVFKY
jgi:hypothetical protein